MSAETPLAAESPAPAPPARRDRRLGFFGRRGAAVLRGIGNLIFLLSVLTRVFSMAVRPRSWPRTTRNVLARQVFFTGVGALRFSLFVALLLGASLVMQVILWLREIGQAELTGPVLVTLVVRGFAPLLANVIVLVRSGSAIVTELATMKVHGEVRLLEAQGLDTLDYLVLPRVIGVAISVLCLTVLTAVTALAFGYAAVVAARPYEDVSFTFAAQLLTALRPIDVLGTLLQAIVPSALMSTICCLEGLGVGRATTEVPQAATRALSGAIAAVLVSSAALSILGHL